MLYCIVMIRKEKKTHDDSPLKITSQILIYFQTTIPQKENIMEKYMEFFVVIFSPVYLALGFAIVCGILMLLGYTAEKIDEFLEETLGLYYLIFKNILFFIVLIFFIWAPMHLIFK